MENTSLLRLEPAGKKDKKYLKALYKRAFPRAERKPFYMFGNGRGVSIIFKENFNFLEPIL